MDPRLLAPLVIAAVVMWSVYRRARRAFGRQRVVEPRMWMRIAVLTIVGALALAASARDARLIGALLVGLLCGGALGYVALRYTRIEVSTEGRFYTPHTYIGLAVMALFVGRVLYRFIALYSGAHGLGLSHAGPYGYSGPYGDAGPYAYQNPYAYQRSPLTLAIFGTLVGYYVLFYLGVLRKTRLSAPSEPANPMH